MDGDWTRYSPPEKEQADHDLVPKPLNLRNSVYGEPVTPPNETSDLFYGSRGRKTSSVFSSNSYTPTTARANFGAGAGSKKDANLTCANRSRDGGDQQISMIEMLNTSPPEIAKSDVLNTVHGDPNTVSRTPTKDNSKAVHKSTSFASLRRIVTPLLTRQSLTNIPDDLSKSESFPEAGVGDRRTSLTLISGPTDISTTYTPTRKSFSRNTFSGSLGESSPKLSSGESTSLASPSAKSTHRTAMLNSDKTKDHGTAYTPRCSPDSIMEEQPFELAVVDQFSRTPGSVKSPKEFESPISPSMSAPVSAHGTSIVYTDKYPKVQQTGNVYPQDVFAIRPTSDPLESSGSTPSAKPLIHDESKNKVALSNPVITGRRSTMPPLASSLTKSPESKLSNDGKTPFFELCSPTVSNNVHPLFKVEGNIHPALRESGNIYNLDGSLYLPLSPGQHQTSQTSKIGDDTNFTSGHARVGNQGEYGWAHAGIFPSSDVGSKALQKPSTSDNSEIAFVHREQQRSTRRLGYGDEYDGEDRTIAKRDTHKGNSWSLEKTPVKTFSNGIGAGYKAEAIQVDDREKKLDQVTTQGNSAIHRDESTTVYENEMSKAISGEQSAQDSEQHSHQPTTEKFSFIRQGKARALPDIRELDEATHQKQIARKKEIANREDAARREKELEDYRTFKVS